MTRPYHHGDLPAALLRAAEEILTTEGLPALTLRAVARRAGVSHMAPAPHFGDLAGLLSELAAVGYRRFNTALAHAQQAPGERSVGRATAHAYVQFAAAEPAMFQLMFRSERLDFSRASLAEAGAQSTALLVSSGDGATGPLSDPEMVGRAVGRWAVVHGFAVLLIDGRLDGALSAFGGAVDGLLDAALGG